ncbi:MAG: ABC transporter permease [Phycisphaerales bacterium]
MMRRFFKSRGFGKLRRNRSAMVALGIIAVYFLAAAWMMAMDAAHWVGKKTELYDISRTPFVSAFLSTRILDEAGPPSLGGFGRPIGLNGRLDYVDYFFSRARGAVDSIQRLDPASDRTPADVFADAAVQERTLADLPVEELTARIQDGEDLLGELDAARSLVNSAQTIAVQVRQARDQLAAVRTATPDDDAMILREEAAFALEDVIGSIETYESVSGDEAAFDEATTDELLGAVDLLYDSEGAIPELESALDRINKKAQDAAEAQADGVEQLLPEAMAFVDQIMPIPSGLDGLSYRVRLLLGTDRQGRSILVRSLASGKVAVQVGVIVGLTAVIFGSLLGAAAAFFGGFVDHAVNWLYSIFSSIPQLVLLAVLSFMFLSGPLQPLRGLPSLFIAFAITYWIGPCRVIRGEAMKIKELEYVQAATAIGFGRLYILVKHILPNTLHLMFINFSLLFVGAIKGEVILTFLGLGLPLGEGASWGIMISQAKSEVVQGFFWQIGAATFFMFVLVLAFNILSDALQDAFDPKHVG